jgi:hypothetical protein
LIKVLPVTFLRRNPQGPFRTMQSSHGQREFKQPPSGLIAADSAIFVKVLP